MVYFHLSDTKMNAIATVACGINNCLGIRFQLCLLFPSDKWKY